MERQSWVDTAKVIGIFLVFYGHFVERLYCSGYTNAYWQFKFIYSFHMPLFFFISGFFGKDPGDLKFGIKKLFLRRMIPVITFTLFMLPLWVGFLYFKGQLRSEALIDMGEDYLVGRPSYAVITWFLVCLLTCEIIALFILQFVRSRKWLLLIALVSLAVGLLVSKYIWSSTGMLHTSADFWYIREGIVALGFYLLGNVLYPYLNQLNEQANKLVWICLGVVALVVLEFSYNLNSPSHDFIVYMIASLHGDIIPFLISAFAGIVLIISLSFTIKLPKQLDFIGKNTLILLGLNSIFHQFLNTRIISLLPFHDHWLAITAYSVVVTVISLVACIPCIFLFNKWIPQLMGKTNIHGPILPNLENIQFRKIFRRSN